MYSSDLSQCAPVLGRPAKTTAHLGSSTAKRANSVAQGASDPGSASQYSIVVHVYVEEGWDIIVGRDGH